MLERAIPAILCSCLILTTELPSQGPPLAGTSQLDWTGDIASRLVDGVDKFLLREIEASVGRRARHWKPDFSSHEAYAKSLEPNRKRLAHILGVRDARLSFVDPELVTTAVRWSQVAKSDAFEAHATRWPVFPGVHGEGLLLVPAEAPIAGVIAIPDAGETPEHSAFEGVGRRLAEAGCLVVVPALIDRTLVQRRNVQLSNREYIYRSAFELGRHLIGYEVQKALALVDWLKERHPTLKVGVTGWGEGAWLALFAGAIEPRIDVVGASGAFDDRLGMWGEPIDRNVFGLLNQFGGAELAAMVAPRPLVIAATPGPEVDLPGKGGAPAKLTTPSVDRVRAEVERARRLTSQLQPAASIELKTGEEEAVRTFMAALGGGASRPGRAPLRDPLRDPKWQEEPPLRLARQIDELDRFNQRLLVESAYVRQEFMKGLDTSSLDKYAQSVEKYRTIFRDDVIGRFDQKPLPFNARSRQSYDQPKWRGYEVVLDVFPDVVAYGILCLPKDLQAGERRPVVVCQHGLEGRPQDVVQGDAPAYHDFAARLAERGFVTFAPQNLYIFGDRFRTLQRKANPLGKTLFSIIVPQHQQIVDWLKTQPFVEASRIAFYGLSYGGKSAMRIPPLVTDYCLSICSADFNEWVWKNASTRSPYSYVWTGEYEIFEFDLGSTFNYAEMAALIAPRPFMVERGHFDGVAPDETVGYEFAKVRHLYAARLGIGDRAEIEWFVGPHTIHGKGTFDFLHRHLKWPVR